MVESIGQSLNLIIEETDDDQKMEKWYKTLRKLTNFYFKTILSWRTISYHLRIEDEKACIICKDENCDMAPKEIWGMP